jgi:hypothetical protein
MSKLYRDSRLQSIRDSARAFAQSKGVTRQDDIVKLQDTAEKALGKFIVSRPHISDQTARELTRTTLRIAAVNAAGNGGAEKLAELNRNGHEIVRSGTNSNLSERALLARANAHLREHEPELHKALDAAVTPELAGIGSHPDILKIVLDEQRQRDMAAERAPTHSKGFHGHQSSNASKAPAAAAAAELK